jgi:hypothetical protein
VPPTMAEPVMRSSGPTYPASSSVIISVPPKEAMLTAYVPRRAADSVLYQVVRDHYETFAAQAASSRDGDGLPRFVDEFRGFLRCGQMGGALRHPPAAARRTHRTALARERYEHGRPTTRPWFGAAAWSANSPKTAGRRRTRMRSARSVRAATRRRKLTPRRRRAIARAATRARWNHARTAGKE